MTHMKQKLTLLLMCLLLLGGAAMASSGEIESDASEEIPEEITEEAEAPQEETPTAEADPCARDLFDGNYSENLSEQAIADAWFLYNSGMRCDEMLPLAERGKTSAIANQMRQKSKKQDATVNIFHVARRPDGTIEPVISAKIPPNDTNLIQSLLRSDEVGVDAVTLDDADSYYVLYNKLLSRPYSDVMIMKYKRTAQGVLYIDIGQQDTKAITYVTNHYLSSEVGREPGKACNTNKTEKIIFYCHKCGNKLVDGSVFCNKCGTRIPCTEDTKRG